MSFRVAPPSGWAAHRTSGRPKRAWGPGAGMSVDSSSPTPPPTQSPLAAATIGFENTWCFSRAWLTTPAVSGAAERSPLMSAPALNARSPAPVRTTQRQLPRSSSPHSRARSAIICRDIALRRDWLAMVTITTWRPWSRARISISVRPEPRDDDDLSVGPAIRQEPDRLDALLEGQPVRDARPEPARLVPGEELVDRPVELVGRVPAEVTERAPQRGAVLDPEPARRDLLDATHEPQ